MVGVGVVALAAPAAACEGTESLSYRQKEHLKNAILVKRSNAEEVFTTFSSQTPDKCLNPALSHSDTLQISSRPFQSSHHSYLHSPSKITDVGRDLQR